MPYAGPNNPGFTKIACALDLYGLLRLWTPAFIIDICTTIMCAPAALMLAPFVGWLALYHIPAELAYGRRTWHRLARECCTEQNLKMLPAQTCTLTRTCFFAYFARTQGADRICYVPQHHHQHRQEDRLLVGVDPHQHHPRQLHSGTPSNWSQLQYNALQAQ